MLIFGIAWSILAGSFGGWFMYNASTGSNKHRLIVSGAWAIVMAIIVFVCGYATAP